ncbi:hypothetical protein E7T09_04435 [Deinococcus sp. KSM4-11]|uniref:hypothetical protein n=1 Tax=Deinococcus sp. KSM4-11 TaxID=2568654 RepID=UPI0010A3B1C2|nr:hypothetical protein [Deinococcus sp. KSM4-11]THF88458.1 hypothetical protein E7T09_04435 [Deinococcus sp. KSM4-11]
MIEYTHRIILERQDGSSEQLGTIDMTGETYGDRTETDAIGVALGELVSTGDFYQWRGVVIPRADFRTLRAELVQASDLSAALPTPPEA